MAFKRIIKPYMYLSLPLDILLVFGVLMISKNFFTGGEYYDMFPSNLRQILMVISGVVLINRISNFLIKVMLFNYLMNETPDALPYEENLDAEILDTFQDELPKDNWKSLLKNINLYLSLPVCVFIAYFGFILIMREYGASQMLEIFIFMCLLIYGISEMYFYRLIKAVKI